MFEYLIMSCRSIFQDLPTAGRPAPLYTSVDKYVPTAAARPDMLLRSPHLESPTRGRPVTSVDEELEKLPTFAAFRRSAVISATKNTHSSGLNARPTGAALYDTSVAISSALAPTATAYKEGGNVEQENSPYPASLNQGIDGETGWGFASHLTQGGVGSHGIVNASSPSMAYRTYGQRIAAASSFSAEGSHSKGTVDAQAAFSTLSTASTNFMRPLPTEFQPRSLGHASMLVQHGRNSDHLIGGLDTAGAGILGQGPDSSSKGSPTPHQSHVGSESTSFASKAAAFEAIRNAGGSRSPPRGVGGVGSMSLAAHAAAAAMKRRQQIK
jgi:hypothetical protein